MAATKLKHLKITSTDLVDQGANPDAHVQLFKSATPEEDAQPTDGFIQKMAKAIAAMFGGDQTRMTDLLIKSMEGDATTFDENLDREKLRRISSEIWDFTYALTDSLTSILFDNTVSAAGKAELMKTSISQFNATATTACEKWAQAATTLDEDEDIMKSETQTAMFETYWNGVEKAAPTTDPQEEPPITKTIQEEETDTMNIDKSKMTPEEQATLADLEKRYGLADGASATPAAPAAPASPELHPEVAKALSDFKKGMETMTQENAELKKSLETANLTAICKKYEVLGKNADELAVKLYDMKKAGGTVYADYVALLDEQVETMAKSGLFGAVGSDRGAASGTIEKAAQASAEVRKQYPDLSTPEAMAKAFEENPELMAQYDRDYKEGK